MAICMPAAGYIKSNDKKTPTGPGYSGRIAAWRLGLLASLELEYSNSTSQTPIFPKCRRGLLRPAARGPGRRRGFTTAVEHTLEGRLGSTFVLDLQIIVRQEKA